MLLAASSPTLPFALRLNIEAMSLFSFATWSIAAVVAAVCFPAPRPPLEVMLWMACVATLCLMDITWRRRCKAAPYGGSYARWRELPALGFRLICSGGGLAAVLMQHWLGSREAEPSDAGSGGSGVGSGVLPAVRDVVLLLFVSGLPAALQAWTWPLRISLAAPAHMAASLVVVRRTRTMCASLEAARPRAAHMAAQVARLLQQLRFTSFSPLTQAPAEEHGECAVALSWLLLALGTALPIAAQAVAECHLFARHQHQRQQLGLPAELGWNARLYGALQEALDALSGLQALAAAWIALGILFDLAQLASS